ncbi:uncharacterized PKHD-type hydroxylase At1g22950 isoform X2 [Eutrema salsugineum]|nr:uncharacterized PKHD-type hydroxylase At1g22950 isoform X2 [Eutrema salsugineum]
MSSDRREMTVVGDGTVGGGVTPPVKAAAEVTVMPDLRLRPNPNNEHRPDNYDDLQLEFSPCIFSSLERYLPLNMLSSNRDDKAKFMSGIILKYLPREERARAKRHMEYKQKIISNYQPLHKELYTLDPTFFFVPSFLKAINEERLRDKKIEKKATSLKSIISEPSPGVLVFDMLQPKFCEMMLSEVENFRKWVKEIKFRIVRPNTMSNYGAVLDDFGLDSMLESIREDFIRPISEELFPDVCGSTLDSHHGFVVEYGKDRDADLGFHVDDSEVTLNVCLGKEFVGGELYFRGTRCEKHVNTDTKSEETFDYCHKPGQAVLHRGRHRHGARATTSGHRVNMILWCRSSAFREIKTYQKEFPDWCGQCLREKKERQRQTLAARKKVKKSKKKPIILHEFIRC